MEVVVEYVRKLRSARPELAEKKGLFLYDHATQHGSEEKMRAIFEAANVEVVLIPKKQTHVFQPADMFVISCIKAATDAQWSKWVETVFEQHDVDEAVDIVASTGNGQVKKQKKYEFIAAALKTVSKTDAVVASWEASGVRRAMGIPPRTDAAGRQKTVVLYDAYVELAQLCGDEEIEENTVPPVVMPEVAVEIARQPAQPAAHPPKIPPKKGPGRPPKQAPAHKGPTLTDFFARKRPRPEEPQQHQQNVIDNNLPEEVQEAEAPTGSSDGESDDSA
jgi:hypothetical protein